MARLEKLFLARMQEKNGHEQGAFLFYFCEYVMCSPLVMFVTFLASFSGLTLLASTIRGVVAPTNQRGC